MTPSRSSKQISHRSVRQNYGGEIELIFGLQKEDDPASLVVERLRARFPERNIRLCIDPRPHGANRKVSNLINMLPLASHDLIVLSDSDIRVAASYLENVISALEEPGVGMVSCLYCGVPAGRDLVAPRRRRHQQPFPAECACRLEAWLCRALLRRHHRPSEGDFGPNRRLSGLRRPARRRLCNGNGGSPARAPRGDSALSLSATFATTGASPILSGMSFARPAPSATSTRGAMRGSS